MTNDQALTAHIIKRVWDERARQKTKYSPQHDDKEHVDGELLQVASDLCLRKKDRWLIDVRRRDRKDQLVIAAALIVAEIERLDRIDTPATPTREQINAILKWAIGHAMGERSQPTMGNKFRSAYQIRKEAMLRLGFIASDPADTENEETHGSSKD